MARTNLKRLFASDGLKVGHSIFEFNSPGLGQILGQADVDFSFIDMEHSGFGYSELKSLITSMRAGNVPSLVRPPSNAYTHIARALDVGADGLLLPMVGSAREAEEILTHMRYPPQGHRGVALGIAHDGYAPDVPVKALAAANRRLAMIALIETRDGIENIDEICAVKGVDAVWIGHFDLSSSLGVAGQFDNPIYTKAVDKVRNAAKKHKKALGILVNDASDGAHRYDMGFDIICYSGDVWCYQTALTRGIEDLRAGCAGKNKGKGKGAKK